MNCTHCRKPLRLSQWREQTRWKSCPHCSQADSEQHVYYPYPECYGTTPLRSTPEHPEGPQSHCQACRQKASPPVGQARRCDAFL